MKAQTKRAIITPLYALPQGGKTIMRGKLGIILLIAFFASPLSAQEFKGTLQQIKKSGQIRIGYRVSEPPMSFLDKDSNPTGYSIDICKGIVTEVENKIDMDVKVEYVPVTADGRFKALGDNKIEHIMWLNDQNAFP